MLEMRRNILPSTLEESVDAEAALYIKELHEDWQNINIIRPTQFSPQKNNFINKESNGEF